MLDRLKNSLFRSTMGASTAQYLDSVLSDKSGIAVSRRAAVPPDALPGDLTPITYVLSGSQLSQIGGEFSWNPKTQIEPTSALSQPTVTEPDLRETIINGAVQDVMGHLAGVMAISVPGKTKARAGATNR